jgi:hypothetical protein
LSSPTSADDDADIPYAVAVVVVVDRAANNEEIE